MNEEEGRIQRKKFRYEAVRVDAPSRSAAKKMPHPATLRFAKEFVKEMRSEFEADTSFVLNTDFTDRSLQELDKFVPTVAPLPSTTALQRTANLGFFVGVGAYFGETLVRNFVGDWKFPSRILLFWAYMIQSPSFYYDRLRVVVADRSVHIVRIARNVWEGRTGASFFRTFKDLEREFGRRPVE